MFEANCCYAKTTNPFALIGNTKEVAPAKATTNNTFALDVVRPATELRKFKALTPYKPDAWEQLLSQAGLLHKCPHNLCFGCIVNLPSITFTQTPTNSSSIIELHPQFTEIVQDKFKKGQYIGPLSKADIESLIRPTILHYPKASQNWQILSPSELLFPLQRVHHIS